MSGRPCPTAGKVGERLTDTQRAKLRMLVRTHGVDGAGRVVGCGATTIFKLLEDGGHASEAAVTRIARSLDGS